MKRRAFLKTGAGAAAIIALQPVWIKVRAAAPPTDELLAQARERIEKNRKGTGSVRVIGPDGRPLSGIKVRLEQRRHDFLFGCNFFMFDHLASPELEQAYREQFAALFNYATLGFYWPSYEPERGKPIYGYTEKVTAWCAEKGITCKGHPLVWDFADPKWLPRDFEEIRTLSNARVREIVSRFKSKIDIWDVVNEPTHLGRFGTRLGEWAMSLGAVPYVTEHLKLARQANPTATLLVNDYRTDPPFYRILRQIREKGEGLFDCIGIQSHMHDGGWPLHRVWDVCDTYANLNVPIHFTETTIVSGPRQGPGENWGVTTTAGEASQAEYVPQFYTMLFAHPSVQAITWWDFSDRGAWQRAPAGWLRRDMKPKPVYDRMLDLVRHHWWTKAEGVTNEQGEWNTSAFYGWHRLTAEGPDGRKPTKDVHWEKGKPNIFHLN